MKKTGFQSPSEDYVEKDTDWNQELIKHPGATFEATAGSDSMIERGIIAGSKVLVDRMIKPFRQNEIVYVRIGDMFYIRQLHFDSEKRLFLAPANPHCGFIEVTEELDHLIIGKVTYTITKH